MTVVGWKAFKIAILVVAGLALLAWCARFLDRQLDVDTCLDRGGAWDYELERCDGAVGTPLDIETCVDRGGAWDFEVNRCYGPIKLPND